MVHERGAVYRRLHDFLSFFLGECCYRGETKDKIVYKISASQHTNAVLYATFGISKRRAENFLFS